MSDELARRLYPFLFGRFATERRRVDYTIDLVRKSIVRLRDLSPL